MGYIRRVAMTLLLGAMLINPVPSKAFVFAIPVIAEGAMVLFSTAEAIVVAGASATTAIVGREATKQGAKYAAKKGIESYVKPKVIKHLLKNTGLNKSMLRDIKYSKIVFNPNYTPRREKQLLYYVSLMHGGKKYYKIGITQRSLRQRYSREYHSAQIKPILMFEMPWSSAANIERAIKTSFFRERVNNRAILVSDGGYSEVYGRDILGLDDMVVSALKMID
jgi:hypothetical protein